MPSLFDRVTRFSRSPKGQSMIREAMNRVTGGGETRKGSRSTSRRSAGGRKTRTAGGRSTRTARKR